jgi:hypothetical protein
MCWPKAESAGLPMCKGHEHGAIAMALIDAMRAVRAARAGLALGCLILCLPVTGSVAHAQSLAPKPQAVLPAPPAVYSTPVQSDTGGGAAKGAASGVATGAPPAALGQAGAQPQVSPPLPVVPGALPWDLLGQVRTARVKDRVLPEFAPAVLKLDRQEVRIAGFMMPLSPAEKQTHFLLTVTSQTCAFCIPAGPEGIVEVRTRTPVRATFDPILIGGRLEVLRDDPMGLYYRISNGEPLTIR